MDGEEVGRPTLRSVEGSGLRQEVVDIIRDAIWHGMLKPGERLNEQRLSRELGVSRPPLREAIRVLEQEGLVESQPRRGTFVCTLAGDDIMEIYTLRCALEGLAAETVAARGDEQALGALERQIELEEEPGLELASLITRDLEFHRLLVYSSGNRRLAQMWDQLASQLRFALTLVDPAYFDSTYIDATHGELVRSMRTRDIEQVRALVGTLLDVGRSLQSRWDQDARSTTG